jgi:predicted ArsR family transcriptional regulator
MRTLGMTLSAIAEALDVDDKTVRRSLALTGPSGSRVGAPGNEAPGYVRLASEAQQMRDDGMSLRAIASVLGVSDRTVRAALKHR